MSAFAKAQNEESVYWTREEFAYYLSLAYCNTLVQWNYVHLEIPVGLGCGLPRQIEQMI